jgi:RPA family protein
MGLAEIVARQSAKRARISDLVGARFFPGDRETLRPSFAITDLGESIARASILGTVVEKFSSEDGRFSSITLDDGTGSIHVRAFAEDTRLIEAASIGDFVSVFGKIKNYNEENYIAPDFVRKISDPNHESLFRLEMLGNLLEKKRAADDLRSAREQMSDEELAEYAGTKHGLGADELRAVLQGERAQVDFKPLVLDAIGKIDRGDGAEIEKILEASGLDESMAESAISELLSTGELYEPAPGKLRKVPA